MSGGVGGKRRHDEAFSKPTEEPPSPASLSHETLFHEAHEEATLKENPCIEHSPESTSKFSGAHLDEMLVIEICAGSARLSKTCRKIGLRAMAIDKITSRGCGTEILVMDLTDDLQFQLLLDIINAERHRIIMIFIAPPCGTASRARERPIKRSLLKNRQAPRPLRTTEQPDGKDGLKGTDKVKTELANQLYQAITSLVLFANNLDLCVVIENPGNSLYWLTSFARAYIDNIQSFWVEFHNCCHGGDRDKLTKFWSNRDWMFPLEMFCDGSHIHKSWRPRVQDGNLVFPTAEEAAYPWLLCTRIANIAKTEVQSLRQQLGDENFTKMNRYLFGALPRSIKLKSMVPEFGAQAAVVSPAQHADFTDAVPASFPKGATVLSRALLQWGKFRTEESNRHKSLKLVGFENEGPSEGTTVEVYNVGVPLDPLEFLYKASEAGHPRDIKRFVGEAVHDVMVENFHRPPHNLAKKRIDFIKKFTNLSLANKVEELKLRVKMPPHLKDLLKGKRLATLSAMLEELGFPDKSLTNDIVSGFKLSGWMTESNLFPKNVKSPSLTVEALNSSCNSFNEKVRKQMNLRQEAVLETDTWRETEHELDQGWIWEDKSGSWKDKIVARRFRIIQGEKTRVIDDCSVCGLNMTVGLKEKFKFHSIDQLCSMLCHSLSLSDDQHGPVLGRTYDLKSAYKQFGLCSQDRDKLRIAVNRPGSTSPTLVGLNALPFGAIGSVAGFLRVSFAVWWIGIFGLGLAWTSYFDDFSVVTRPELENNTNWAVTALFELIGLQYAKEGPKAPPFSETFKMLGLVVCMSSMQSGVFDAGHTAERRAELASTLQQVLDKGELTTKEAERVRGRMIFFECFVFGRTSNLAIKQFGELRRAGRSTDVLTGEQTDVVKRLLDRVNSGIAVPINLKCLATWLIFTDGACEGSGPTGSVGGVLVAPNHQVVRHFGCVVPDSVMQTLLLHSRRPIHELEMIPVLISLTLWSSFLVDSQVMHYIDNESVRLALLRGSGETVTARKVAHEIVQAESKLSLKTWYARVASHSNISDGPSRGDFELVLSLGSTFCEVDWERISKCIS